MVEYNPNLTINIITPLINSLIESYYNNPTKNWMDKIVAINLIFAVTIKTFAQRSKLNKYYI